jgi:hypothetical protein
MAKFDVPIFWGGIRLWAEAGDVDVSRTLTPHELVQGDEHPLHDAGLAAKPIRLSILFDEFPDEPLSAEDRLQRLLAQHRTGRSFMFSHPIEGNFLAKIGQFQYRQDDDSNYTADITFYPSDQDTPVSPAGAGVPAIAGETSVDAAADALDDAVEDLDEDLQADANELAAAARAASSSWIKGAEVLTRKVMADLADITNRINALIVDHFLDHRLELFDAWLAAILLGDSTREAAAAATSEVAKVFTVRIEEPVVLLALCAQIYGGADAPTRERQIREMNDLRSSTWIGPGQFVFPQDS